jgi:hypothetical protein
MTMLDAASSAVAVTRSAWVEVAVSTVTLRSCEYSRVTVNSRASGVQATLLCRVQRALAEFARSFRLDERMVSTVACRCMQCCSSTRYNGQGFVK